MKLLVLLALASLLPLVSASEQEVGPCLVRSDETWPGYVLLVSCRDYSGDEMIRVADGTCNGDFNGLTLLVYGAGVDCLP